ncbi:Protein SOSEKI 1 [Sporothrix stenoceras]|uniref:Protein SOSEKI 1 n=1 Tax=Sporothrix stenoceras TaxID=5173 RepID=A0ABR3ZTH2_9PEZI
MSEQGAGGGVDSTLTSGHSRGQPSDETTSTEQTSEVRGQPAPQRSVNSNFAAAIIPSEQDPRSSEAGASTGTRSPPVTDSPSPSMAYEASQQQQPLQQVKAQDGRASHQPTLLQRAQETMAQNKQRRLQLKEQQQLRQQQQQLLEQQNKAQQLEQQQRQEEQQQHSSSSTQSPERRRHRHSSHHDQSLSHKQQASKIELPVTKATLSELDVNKIIHNPKLRHDINYDPELHFRPNLDGEKGRRKQDKAQQFWDNLRDELAQFVTDRDAFLKAHGPDDNDWTLPALLNAVKDIIQTLVPARDRDLLNEGLNVPLLMQQFARGVVDLEKLAAWLSSVLKLHCAPMRDDWVDEMYNELSRGNRDNDVAELVKGMCSLLSVLEAMKLDVANHQIRCLRPLLIEDTVHFEQRFFHKKIQNRRMSVSAARNWYEQAKSDFASPSVRHRQAFGNMAVFFSGLVHLLLPSVEASQVPNTFLFDEDRIVKLRSDMFDAIHLEVCMKVYEMAEMHEIAESQAAAAQATEASMSHASRHLAPNGVPSYLGTQSQAQSPNGDAWASYASSSLDEFDFNTPPQSATSGSPTSSRPTSLDFSACGSATSSPRNSGLPLGGDGAGAPPQLPEDFAEARQRSQNLYSSLVALLQSVPATARPSERWEDLWPLMAVEIYRTLSNVDRAQHVSLEQIEQRLKAAMSPDADIKKVVEHTFRERLLSALARRVKDYKTMPNVGLFVVAAGGRIHPTPARAPEGTSAAAAAATAAAAAATALMERNTRPIDPREDGCVEDMATRLAHLGILHWRVWGRLVYDPQPEMPADAPIPVPM